MNLFIGISGHKGSGKSTLLNIVASSLKDQGIDFLCEDDGRSVEPDLQQQTSFSFSERCKLIFACLFMPGEKVLNYTQKNDFRFIKHRKVFVKTFERNDVN